MAKRIFDELINEFLEGTTKRSGGRWDTVLRDHYGGQYPHTIVVTVEDLENIFTHNTIWAIHNDKNQKEVFAMYGVKTPKEQIRSDTEEAYWSSSDAMGQGDDIDAMDQYVTDNVRKVEPQDQIDAAHRLVDAVEDEIIVAGKQAASQVHRNLDSIFIPNSSATKIWKDGDRWKIRTTLRVDTLSKALKAPVLKKGLSIISKALESSHPEFAAALNTDKAAETLSRRTQFLHEGSTTLGVTHLKRLLNRMEDHVWPDNEMMNLAKGPAMKAIWEVFGPYKTTWVKKPKANAKNLKGYGGFKEDLEISGTLGPTSLNPQGSEDTDWKQLRPKLEKTLIDELAKDPKTKKFATAEGSKSFVQRIGERTAAQIADDIVLSVKGKKGVKVVKRQTFSEKKGKDVSSSFTKKSNVRQPKGKGITRKASKVAFGAAAAKKNRSAAQANTAPGSLELVNLLNASLTEEIIKNMGSPRLNNRKGRFADSVQVIKVNQGRGLGIPNVMYGYDMEPYGVFEVGRGKRPWANTDRDPRTLIDKSIREVAQGLAMSRLTTTRI